MSPPGVEVQGLTKRYHGGVAVDDLLRAARQGDGLPGPERGRQEHHAAHGARTGAAASSPSSANATGLNWSCWPTRPDSTAPGTAEADACALTTPAVGEVEGQRSGSRRQRSGPEEQTCDQQRTHVRGRQRARVARRMALLLPGGAERLNQWGQTERVTTRYRASTAEAVSHRCSALSSSTESGSPSAGRSTAARLRVGHRTRPGLGDEWIAGPPTRRARGRPSAVPARPRSQGRLRSAPDGHRERHLPSCSPEES